ncbi:MAG: hypothetical protein AABW73_00385 [Nanoarchaeota archaeon]
MTLKSITPELEHKLTVSNLVFLAISKLSIRQLEILKKVHKYHSVKSSSLIREVERRLGFSKKKTISEIEELGELKLLAPRIIDNSRELELTELGELITAEVEREV